MQSQETVIELYKCFSCAKQVFMVDIKAGLGCSCGSRRVVRAQPTLRYVLGYIMKHPSVLKVFWRENVLGRA